jgi:hypothetical protein
MGCSIRNQRLLRYSGKITAVELRNPHSFFWMDAMDSSGVVHNWKAEYGGVWRLEIPGIDRSIGLSGADEKRILGALKPGAAVSVEGIRAKDGSFWISFKFLSDDQGKTLIDMRRACRAGCAKATIGRLRPRARTSTIYIRMRLT